MDSETTKENLSEKKTNEATNDKQPSASQSLPRISIISKAKKKIIEFFGKANSWVNNYEKILSFTINSIAIIVAIYLLFYTQEQVEISQNALRFQRESDSLNGIAQQAIADSSIALSKLIADTQERFAKVQNRAYVSYIVANLDTFVIGKPMTASVRFMNNGNTPAYGCSVLAYIQPIPKPREDWKPNPPKSEDQRSVIVIGPKSTVEMKFFALAKVETEHVDLIRKGIYEIFICGTIWYRDVWKESHYTNFCVKYSVKAKSFVGYHKYNDAD